MYVKLAFKEMMCDGEKVHVNLPQAVPASNGRNEKLYFDELEVQYIYIYIYMYSLQQQHNYVVPCSVLNL